LVYFDQTKYAAEEHQRNFFVFISACMMLANKIYSIYCGIDRYIIYFTTLNPTPISKFDIISMEKVLIEYFGYHINQKIPTDYLLVLNQLISLLPLIHASEYNVLDIEKFSALHKPDCSQSIISLKIENLTCLQ
jgi:hypothetical protein